MNKILHEKVDTWEFSRMQIHDTSHAEVAEIRIELTNWPVSSGTMQLAAALPSSRVAMTGSCKASMCEQSEERSVRGATESSPTPLGSNGRIWVGSKRISCRTAKPR